MQPEDDQQLWDLLGRTAEPRLSPFFARNVVREVRQEVSRFRRAQNWFSWRRIVAASAVAVIAIGIGIATHPPGVSQKSPDREFDMVAKIDPQDFDVVADLDELLAWDEDSLWNGNQSL
jgi:anti-sigma factor RsiW